MTSSVDNWVFSQLPNHPHCLNLQRGVVSAAAKNFKIHQNSVKQLWERAREIIESHRNPHENTRLLHPNCFTSRIKGNSGRKQKWNRDAVRIEIKAVPLCQQQTLQDLAKALGIPHGAPQDATNLFLLSLC